ncbi:DUF4974 domain-containing protein [Prolixibacteraceae bacterium JC049]|nr:DUF4974 domain-containing protein [Prolixibacteraceae bacterium JC049]
MKNDKQLWELITSNLYRENSNDEQSELDKQLQSKKRNEKLNDSVHSLHVDILATNDLRGFSKEKSWNNIRKEVLRKRMLRFLNVAKYAAIVIVSFLLGTLFLQKAEKGTSIAEIRVPLGQMTELTLDDGTQVWLNSGSTLKYDTKSDNERLVTLEGEAFFDVTKNGTPFKVFFKDAAVEVLGTRFNVIAYHEEPISQVTLVEGKVNINRRSTLTKLHPSEQITISDKHKNMRIDKVNTDFYVSWTEGKMVFEEERLVNVTKKLERWYNVEIRFTEESVKNLYFCGTILKNKPFDQIINAFELLLPVKIQYKHNLHSKDQVIISKR